MKRYVLALNPDDFLYADAVERFLKLHSARIDSVCIFPSQANVQAKRSHFLANLRILGVSEFLKISLAWVLRRNRPSIRKAAQKYGVPVFEMKSVNSEEFSRHITSRSVFTILNICSQIYKKETLNRIGPVYNYHGGYVPGNAGRFPVFWAYLKGMPQVVTCHRVSEVIDGGAPLLHVPIQTTLQDSVWQITEKMMRRFPEIIERSMRLIDEGKSETMSLNIPEIYGPRPTQKDIALYRELLFRNRSTRH